MPTGLNSGPQPSAPQHLAPSEAGDRQLIEQRPPCRRVAGKSSLDTHPLRTAAPQPQNHAPPSRTCDSLLGGPPPRDPASNAPRPLAPGCPRRHSTTPLTHPKSRKQKRAAPGEHNQPNNSRGKDLGPAGALRPSTPTPRPGTHQQEERNKPVSPAQHPPKRQSFPRLNHTLSGEEPAHAG